GGGLRHGPARRRQAAHVAAPVGVPRYARLHEPRADPRGPRRSTQRHLLVGRDCVRTAHRHGPVLRRQLDGDDGRTPHQGSGAHSAPAPGRLPWPRGRRAQGHATVPGAPLPVGGRARRRSRRPRHPRRRQLRSVSGGADGWNGGDRVQNAPDRPGRAYRGGRRGDRPLDLPPRRGGWMNTMRWIRLGFVDVFGTANSVLLPADRWDHAVAEGVAFDGSALEGRARVFESDLLLRPVAGTLVDFGDGTGRAFCDILTLSGTPWLADPRTALKDVVDRLGEVARAWRAT